MGFFSKNKDDNKPEMTIGQVMQIAMRIASAAATGGEKIDTIIKEVIQNFVTDSKVKEFLATAQKEFVNLERKYNSKMRVVLESNVDFSDLVIRIWLQEPNSGNPKLWVEKYGAQMTQADLIALIDMIYTKKDGISNTNATSADNN